MKKKILSFALAMCMAFGTAAALPDNVFSETAYAANSVNTDTSGKCGDNVSWSLSSAGVLTISGSGAMYDTYSGYLSEKYSPFYGRSAIKSVVIKQGVTTIGKHMFGNCKSITSVTIPSSVTQIGEYAFYYCEGLKKLTVPDSVTNIDVHAFDHCISLESVTLTNGLTKLNGDVFGYCNSLKSVTIPKNVSTIVWSAFEQCANLASISVAADNSSFCSVDGVLYDKDKTKVVICPLAKTSVTFPSSLKTIGYHSFGYCAKLTEIKIPESVTALEDLCFCHCEALKTLTIPKNVTKYDEGCTFRCDNLTAINFDKDNTKYTSVDGVVYNKAITTLVCCPEGKANVTIPDTVTSIADWSLNTNNKITSITIPNSVKSIGIHAFRDCENLESISIPDSVTQIGRSAFYGCKSLESLELPSGLTAVKEFLLYGCESITDLTIPSNVTTIEERVFYRCNSLNTVLIPASVVDIGENLFQFCKPNVLMKCYKNSNAYKYALENNIDTELLDEGGKKHINARAAGCTENGNIEYWFLNNKYYTDEQCTKETTKEKTVVKPIGHNWITKWEWNGTKEATLDLSCKNSYSHGDTIKATVTSNIIKPTCEKDGTTVYTATTKYEDETFTDTKEITTSKTRHKWSAPTYTWSADNKTCTAAAVCANDKSHTVTEKVTAAYKETKAATTTATGVGTYTATFKNSLFKAQTKNITLAKKEITTQRIAGANRFATAAEISKASFKTANTVVLAYGLNYADALAGVTLANKLNAPILLTYTAKLPDETQAEIKRLGAKKVIILGGTGAISKDVEESLKKSGLTTERYAGTTRFGTATAIAEKLNDKPTDVFFVYAFNYADALSVSTVAALKNAPIIYLKTNGDLDNDTADYLAKLKKAGSVKNAYVIGGEGVISKDMLNKAGKALGVTPTRVAGKNRYATCTEVNNKFKDVLTGSSVCVAKGLDFPDALAGGVFAAANKAPLFLADNTLKDEQKTYLKGKKADTFYVFGGTGAVPDKLVSEITTTSK